MKFKDWDGNDLKGDWQFTIKLDGVRAHQTKDGWVSRTDKKLYNIPLKKDVKVAEIYAGDFKETLSIVRASKSERRMIKKDEIFSIEPLDSRLMLGSYTNPTKHVINEWFKTVQLMEVEGLVLRQGDTYIKVKDKYTVDVKITGIVEGEGKHKGRLGKFITEKGGVGTGFSDVQRIEYYTEALIGTYVEVETMELTPNGKFRHPRFVRLRPDKS
jgi:hypothetical protein